MKNGQAFPDPIKGDPALLGAIHRRQQMPPAGAQFVNMPFGAIVSKTNNRRTGRSGNGGTLVTNADESGARVLIDTDPAGEVSSEYVLRRIVADEVDSGQPTVTVEESGETIVIGLENIPSPDDYPPGGLGGGNLNLLIEDKQFSISDGKMVYDGSSNSRVYRWRNGIYMGAFSVMSPPFDGDDELTIDERSVDYWSQSS